MAYYPLKVKDSGGTVHVVGDPRIADKADKASPALTGVPTAPTAAVDTNTTQVATTGFVVGQAASAAPTKIGSGVQEVGTSNRYARADHRHETYLSGFRGFMLAGTFTGTGLLFAPGSSNDHYVLKGDSANSTHGLGWGTLTSASVPTVAINTQSASYTLDLADAGKAVLMGSASAQVVTIPLNSAVEFPVGTKIDIVQTGAGACSVAPASGVTLNSDTSKRTVNVQYAAVSCIKTATDTWLLIGALKA